jgi:hypothetical protein
MDQLDPGALDAKATANTLMVKILDEIYTVSPLPGL